MNEKGKERLTDLNDVRGGSVRESEPRPAGRRFRWKAATAAVLAIAILAAGVGLSGMQGGSGLAPTAYALAAAEYPEMHPYPRDDDYFSDYTSDSSAAYDRAYGAWRRDMEALRSGTDYTGLMDGFLSASTAQFLSGAGEENRVYSPLNVYMALAMLAETTGGNSRAQLLELLEADSIETLRTRARALWRDHYRDDGTVTTILGNSLWLKDGMTYSQKVLDTLAGTYYASSFSGEMGSEAYNQALRDWLNQQTHGLLEEQANGLEMEPETVLALASTLYFKAAWSDEFNKANTERDVFHAPGGDVEADFMRRGMEGTYFWGEGFAAVQLYFQRGGSMWLILPDKGVSVEELLRSGGALDFLLADKYGRYDEESQQYVGAWPGQKYLTIHLSMPRFDVSSDLDLIGGLKSLGVTDVFDWGTSNFDPLEAGTDDPLYVSKAQHAARVKVDEEGCEAAAYTVLMMEAGAAAPPDDEVDFVLDRPFLFAVTGDTGLPLFVGTVNQPNG